MYRVGGSRETNMTALKLHKTATIYTLMKIKLTYIAMQHKYMYNQHNQHS